MSSSEKDMMYISPSSPEFFRIDDLLDFSNEDLFSSSTTTTETDLKFPPPDQTTTSNHFSTVTAVGTATTNFSHDLCVPSDDVAELEWLSTFVDDSSSHFPITNFTTNTVSVVPGKARSKRSKPVVTRHSWTSSLPEPDSPAIIRGRKCTHCASEKTPQWRTGPMGPKTLCNACGVRYKSGRLVPEYRPAASPTFVLTQHSNSHRKVLELRRQKEVVMDDNNSNNCHHEFFHNHHDFKVC
ncbi:Gata transcription factor [Thalictrum thalictroides]|uniref:GATA transcription factor n=1 Tax=Thalictrum thalictroides TaxID=46969 RepID=A0A7J6X5X5_THATH|nr:Gata transcription factor [Thalictrum thalictroides]